MKHLACPLLLLCALLPRAAAGQMPGRVDQLGDTATFQSSDRVLCYTGGRLQLCTPKLVQDASLVGGRTLAARALDIVNPADDGMKCDGITNDTAALNAAIARSRLSTIFGGKVSYGMQVQLPMGRCVVNGLALTLTGNQSLTLAGYGPEMTELMVANDADGLAVTLDSNGAWLRDTASGTTGAAVIVRDLALVRTVASEGRTAITVTSTATANPGARQVTLRNVTMRGVAGASAWQNGYTLTNTTGTLVEDLYFHTAHSTGVGTGTTGTYATTGSFISTEHHITRGNTQGQAVCYRFGGKTQGVTIDHLSCVGAQTGIIGTSDDGTNDSLLITSSHFDTLQAAIQVSGWNNVSVVNSYLLANNPSSSNTWTGMAATQGARLMFTANHVFGRAGSTGQSLVAVSNTTGLDGQTSVSVVGNAAEYLPGPMVQLLNQTSRAQVVGNNCLTCGSLGTDARGVSSWSANTINGKLLMSGLDGALVVGAGTQAVISADGGGSLNVGAANTIFPNTILMGAGATRTSLAADGGGSFTMTGPNLSFNGTVLINRVPLCSVASTGVLCAVSAAAGSAVQVK